MLKPLVIVAGESEVEEPAVADEVVVLEAAYPFTLPIWMGAGCRFRVVTEGERTFEIRPCSASAWMIRLDPAHGELEVSKMLSEPETASLLIPEATFFRENPHLLFSEV